MLKREKIRAIELERVKELLVCEEAGRVGLLGVGTGREGGGRRALKR